MGKYRDKLMSSPVGRIRLKYDLSKTSFPEVSHIINQELGDMVKEITSAYLSPISKHQVTTRLIKHLFDKETNELILIYKWEIV